MKNDTIHILYKNNGLYVITDMPEEPKYKIRYGNGDFGPDNIKQQVDKHIKAMEEINLDKCMEFVALNYNHVSWGVLCFRSSDDLIDERFAEASELYALCC